MVRSYSLIFPLALTHWMFGGTDSRVLAANEMGTAKDFLSTVDSNWKI
jgi:hypothetical protein